MTITPDLIEKILWAALSALLTGGAAYIVVAKDLAFLKGQNSMILQQLSIIGRLKDKLLAMEVAQTKHKADLDHAFDKIRDVQRVTQNGTSHP